jgi:hypothetical protein
MKDKRNKKILEYTMKYFQRGISLKMIAPEATMPKKCFL